MLDEKLSDNLRIDDETVSTEDGESLFLSRHPEGHPHHMVFMITGSEARALLQVLIKRFPLDALGGS